MRWTGWGMRLLAVVACVALAVSVTAPAGTAVGVAASDAGGREYKVQPGDTLWAIAGSELGDPYRWPEIAAASESIVQPSGAVLTDPDRIRPGWTFILPAGSDSEQVPTPTATPTQTPVRIPASDVSGATEVAADGYGTCAIVSGGRVICWGESAYGQPLDGPNSRPTAVSGLSGASEVDTGQLSSCALVAGGRVTCWGWEIVGEVGDGATREAATSPWSPVMLSKVSAATALAARGGGHACAVIKGKVACWGQNGFGQLGDGTTQDSATPVAVREVSGATDVATGSSRACAIITGGRVACWGWNEYGQSGDGTSGGLSITPVMVAGLSGATTVAVGWGHTCALLTSGQVACWGINEGGQLGDGTTKDSATPVMVSGLSGATALATGDDHTCAVVADGTVACWGENEAGQLGDGTRLNRATPVVVQGVSGATDAAAGSFHSCATIAGGRVTCWGSNDQWQLGYGFEAN